MLAFRLFDNKWLSFQIEELKTSAKRKRKDQKERKEGHGQADKFLQNLQCINLGISTIDE